jgi:D-glycero-D-manno-heptose 1,7-bisphosphate phosphatase
MRPAIFLDRDGVIIENRSDYVRTWEDVAFIPGALEALAEISRTEFAIVIVTNQAGVGRGLISETVARSINQSVCEEIVRSGGRVDGMYLCPHTNDDDCECRKPKPGMLLQAAREHDIDLSHSWMIGDALTDLQAGKAAGAQSLLVLTGRGTEQQTLHGLDGYTSVAEALAYIRGEAVKR